MIWRGERWSVSRCPVDVPRMLASLGIEASRRGREWVARCPNSRHDDRTPSWRIVDDPRSEKHGFHHCFSCSFGGGPVDLVTEVYGFADRRSAVSWLDACRGSEEERLAEEFAAAVEWRIIDEGERDERPFAFPVGVVIAPLAEWPESVAAYAALRGITAEQVDRFGIGYAVIGRLAGRIVLPARDAVGVAKCYAARTFVGAEKRYLSADSRDRPDRSILFGENLWPTTRRRVAVCEGAINALAVDRAFSGGIAVAAIDGSEPREAHLCKLATFAEVVLVVDPDTAGDKAARRIEDALSRWSVVCRAVLPRGLDARDVEMHEGCRGLRARIDSAKRCEKEAVRDRDAIA